MLRNSARSRRHARTGISAVSSLRPWNSSRARASSSVEADIGVALQRLDDLVNFLAVRTARVWRFPRDARHAVCSLSGDTPIARMVPQGGSSRSSSEAGASSVTAGDRMNRRVAQSDTAMADPLNCARLPTGRCGMSSLTDEPIGRRIVHRTIVGYASLGLPWCTLRCRSHLRSESLLAQVTFRHVPDDGHHPFGVTFCVLYKLDRELDGNPPAILVQRRHGEQVALSVTSNACAHCVLPASPMTRAERLGDDEIHRGLQYVLGPEAEHALRRGVPYRTMPERSQIRIASGEPSNMRRGRSCGSADIDRWFGAIGRSIQRTAVEGNLQRLRRPIRPDHIQRGSSCGRFSVVEKVFGTDHLNRTRSFRDDSGGNGPEHHAPHAAVSVETPTR